MPLFQQTIKGHMIVKVEAKDMYEADDKIAAMSGTELENHALGIEWFNYDTDEFPTELYSD